VVGYFRFLLRIFFRRIEVTGLENLPEESGGLLISWHPNGAVDGAVLVTQCPRPIVTGARHGLLQIPVLGWMMRQVGVLPIYRSQDLKKGDSDAERKAGNRTSIAFVTELKVGAAHLYYRAVELAAPDGPRPVIVPVALHYNKKSVWGSQVLMTFHPALSLDDDLAVPAEDPEARREQARRLTDRFDRVLREVVLATESWELHHLLQRARKLIRAEDHARRGAVSQPSDIVERMRHFGRIWKNYQVATESHPEETEALLASVEFYDRCLRALKIEDHELDGASWKLSTRKTLLLLLQFLVVYLVLPFFLVIGAVVNLPPLLLLQGLTKTAANKYKDEASIKMLVGAVLFPVTWLLASWLVAWGGGVLAASYPEIPYSPALTFVLAFVLSAFGGLLALQFRELATETLHNLRVRLTLTRRKHAVEWLQEERSSLFDRFIALDRKLGSPAKAERGA
jgi:1-acyl-sn-glycerol-3-phosphate acyltransferase